MVIVSKASPCFVFALLQVGDTLRMREVRAIYTVLRGSNSKLAINIQLQSTLFAFLKFIYAQLSGIVDKPRHNEQLLFLNLSLLALGQRHVFIDYTDVFVVENMLSR